MKKLAQQDYLRCINNAGRFLDLIVKVGYNFAPKPLKEIADAINNSKEKALAWARSETIQSNPESVLDNDLVQWAIKWSYKGGLDEDELKQELHRRLFSAMISYNEAVNDKTPDGFRFKPSDTEEDIRKNRMSVLEMYRDDINKFFANTLHIIFMNFDNPKSEEEIKQEEEEQYKRQREENARRMVAKQQEEERQKKEREDAERAKMLARMKMLPKSPFDPKPKK